MPTRQRARHQDRASANQHTGTVRDQGEVSTVGQESLASTSLQRALRNPHGLTSTAVLQLQRTIGNRAVTRLLGGSAPARPSDRTGASAPTPSAQAADTGATVRLPLRDIAHPVAVAMAQPSVRFRVPTFERLKAAYTDKDLKIPQKVIQDRIAQLLGRMAHEGRLKSKDTVPVIIGKIFPSPGVIDEAEFNKAVDVADRTIIYQSVLDADTTVKPVDTAKLQAAMVEAGKEISKAEGDAAGLTAVFGAQASVAKANYAKARTALDGVSKNMKTRVSTDYNLDDPEVGLGGWADAGAKHMHLLVDVVKGTDPAETKATLIHEAAHLGDAAVDDHVYYDTKGFFELDEAKKVANAAHYEELPRRSMGTSSFAGKTFTPGVKAAGGAVTKEDTVRAAAANYLREAWDAAVDTHTLVRGVRQAYLRGNGKPFKDHQALLLEISKLIDLTIHEQAASKAVVTTLDVTLTESIARGVSIVGGLADSVAWPNPVGALTDTELRDLIVAGAVTKYGNLLKDAKRDKAMLDWFVAHYHSLPSA